MTGGEQQVAMGLAGEHRIGERRQRQCTILDRRRELAREGVGLVDLAEILEQGLEPTLAEMLGLREALIE